MKYWQLFQISLAVLVLSTQGICSVGAGLTEPNLSLTIHYADKKLKAGDEIPIVFTITNQGKSSYFYYGQTGYHGNDRRRVMEQYKLVAKREDGTTVPDPLQRYSGGEGYASPPEEQIESGESFSKTIALNQWALINEPGRYTITGTYYTGIFHLRSKHPAVSCAPIEIIVRPRTNKEMAEYIKELSKKLKGIKIPKTGMTRQAWKEIVGTVKRLMYTCDPRIVPTLIDAMYEYNGRFNGLTIWTIDAFLYYLPRDTKIKNTILRAAKKDGLAYGMQYVLEELDCNEEEFKGIIKKSLTSENPDVQSAGAEASQRHPDDSYTTRLIAIATDANSRARWAAIDALAYNRTDAGVKTLKVLLKNTNQDMRETAAHAIQRSYQDVPIYPKRANDEYTSALIRVVKDPNSSKWMFAYAITEIARTRSEEGIEAIKALLENPDRDIPIAKTDEGVRTIGNLLRSPDKDVRNMTENIIRQVYRTYPGQPLREDDFPELFKEAQVEREKQKKRTLEWLKSNK